MNSNTNLKPLRCEGCDEMMEAWDAVKTKENAGEESLDSDGNLWLVWSVEDCKECTFNICEQCSILQVEHTTCEAPMQILGHQGYADDHTENMRDVRTGMKTRLDNAKLPDPSKARFDISDLGQTKVRLNEWALAGPKYDQPHFLEMYSM